MGILANMVYGFPSRKLQIIGVTGTDGKTTTATLLYHILTQSGFKVALISTVSAKIGNEDIDTGFHVTSPDHFPLQKLLLKIKKSGCTHVVLETTSHGFAQHRFWGIKFTGGIITNISRDHLDYHQTMHNYAAEKAKLFASTKYAVLNQDDDFYEFIRSRTNGKVSTYGAKAGHWNLQNFTFELSMIGSYNRLNALAAAAMASHLGVPKKEIQKALKHFPGVKGRMQVMHKKPLVVVDFAHTPNGLESALKVLKEEATSASRVISVFGCAGHRDANRRKMGKVSAQNADITVITAEDPRTEGVEKISAEIASWAEAGGARELSSEKLTMLRDHKASAKYQLAKAQKILYPIYIKVPDRQQAINLALKLARKQDIVGVFGKGHEETMCFGTTETPWSDQKAVQKALKALIKNL
jgi:UDP-N-acetylmuramoyl-L-alanyl-D-glutamate--2,6-diaminopimelate ligase